MKLDCVNSDSIMSPCTDDDEAIEMEGLWCYDLVCNIILLQNIAEIFFF